MSGDGQELLDSSVPFFLRVRLPFLLGEEGGEGGGVARTASAWAAGGEDAEIGSIGEEGAVCGAVPAGYGAIRSVEALLDLP